VLRPFPVNPRCPVCGDPAVNPAALGVRWFYDTDAHRVVGTFTGAADHSGYADAVHGGIVASLLDECLAWACAVGRGTYFVTGELTLKYKRPAPLGAAVTVSGRTSEARGPYVRAAGEARLADGTLVATAVGTFAAMPRAKALALRAGLVLGPDDLDVLAEA
jgi:acyl-coenzyme A thioesterase PaaI-like protein